jgi:hypothetical protein
MADDYELGTPARLNSSIARLDRFIDQAKQLDPDDRLRLILSVWSTLPPDHLETLDNTVLADFRQRILQDRKPTKVYSAPRRFDLATLFVVTLAFSLLFGAMKAFSFPAEVSASIAGFIAVIGAGQALLFGGQRPRTASLVTGSLVYTIIMLAAWLYSGPRMTPWVGIVFGATYGIIGGGILGYLSGVFIGGVFLVSDKVRKLFFKPPSVETPAED